MNSGIYEIENTVNGKRYIGSAKDFRQRWCEHRTELTRGVHVNKHLLAAWRKYGSDVFVFRKLLICAPEHLVMFEQQVMDRVSPEYNKTPQAGSSLGFKHSVETRKKIKGHSNAHQVRRGGCDETI